ncbi:MAG: glycosyltransferase [Planctomycetota bacterium]
MDDMKPWLSVVIPCYNGADLVGATIRSVIDQAGPDQVEVIVVDDGSTDGSAEAVEAFGDRVMLLRQENAGQSVARNHGMSRARGEWILFLDADDLVRSGGLEIVRSVAEGHPGAVMIATKAENFSDPGAIDDSNPTDPIIRERRDYLEARSWVFPSSAFLRRATVESVGGWRETRAHAEELDLWLKLGDAGTVVTIVEPPLIWRRLHESQATTNLRLAYDGGLMILEAERQGEYPGGNARARDRGQILLSVVSAICYRLAANGDHLWVAKLYLAALPLALRTPQPRFFVTVPLFTIFPPVRRFAARVRQTQIRENELRRDRAS